MGKIKYISIFLLFLLSCNDKKYKYHVKGQILTDSGFVKSEWYSDTIFLNSDTAFYYNSDSSIVKIYPPFIIYKVK